MLKWTPEDVEIRLEQAAKTERELPDKERRFLILKTSWRQIEFVRDFFINTKKNIVGTDRETYHRIRIIPSAKDISEMEECLKWYRAVTRSRHKDTTTLGRILWARAKGFSNYQIAKFVGKSPETVRVWGKMAIKYITDALNRGRL